MNGCIRSSKSMDKDFFRKRYCLVTYDSIQLNKAENFNFAADFYDLYEMKNKTFLSYLYIYNILFI